MAMALADDGKLAATGGQDGTIRIWDVATGKLMRALVGHTSALDCLSWSPDGRTLASTAAYDATLRLWDVQPGVPLRQFHDFKEYTRQVAWSAVGGRLAVAGGGSGRVWVWDEKSNQGHVVAEVGKPLWTVAWSPNGEQLALAVREGPALILDAMSGKVVHSLGEAQTQHFAACWSPDGSKLHRHRHQPIDRLQNARRQAAGDAAQGRLEAYLVAGQQSGLFALARRSLAVGFGS